MKLKFYAAIKYELPKKNELGERVTGTGYVTQDIYKTGKLNPYQSVRVYTGNSYIVTQVKNFTNITPFYAS